jgi:hypothetical protein
MNRQLCYRTVNMSAHIMLACWLTKSIEFKGITWHASGTRQYINITSRCKVLSWWTCRPVRHCRHMAPVWPHGTVPPRWSTRLMQELHSKKVASLCHHAVTLISHTSLHSVILNEVNRNIQVRSSKCLLTRVNNSSMQNSHKRMLDALPMFFQVSRRV